MGFLIKLILAGVLIAVLIPFVGPETSAGRVIGAAFADLSGFCERQPEACAEGASIAEGAGDLIASTIAEIRGQAASDLTAADRALAPDSTIPPIGDASREAFAGHNGAIHY